MGTSTHKRHWTKTVSYIGDNTDSKASDLKRPLAFLFTMNLKGGTLCQAKPKNISPLPSARPTA